jgi:hypothetical protein
MQVYVTLTNKATKSVQKVSCFLLFLKGEKASPGTLV